MWAIEVILCCDVVFKAASEHSALVSEIALESESVLSGKPGRTKTGREKKIHKGKGKRGGGSNRHQAAEGVDAFELQFMSTNEVGICIQSQCPIIQ